MGRFFLLCLLVFSSQILYTQSITWITACSDQTFCYSPGGCNQGPVFLVEKAVTNCNGSGTINYSYKIDLDNNGGIDIQSSADTVNQVFQKGTHKIYWKAADNCGNAANCTYVFTVKDCQPPNLLCVNGLTQSLDLPDCEVSFMASSFILSMSDNCTPTNQLQLGIRKAGAGTGFPNATSVTYGQCEAGTNIIEVWVKEANGLVNSCNNYVLVQTNSGVCICNPDGDLQIHSCGRTAINTKIPGEYNLSSTMESLSGVQPPLNKVRQQTVTDSCASILYDKLPFGGTYQATLRASKADNPLNGVTTFDLVIISKHILNIQPFQSIYQTVAADVNKSNTVTATDIVEIRKLILGLTDSFQYVPAWRLIRPIANPANLIDFSAVKDTYQINLPNLQNDVHLPALPFIGIKYGDLNSTAAALTGDADDRDDQTPLRLVYEDRWLNAGELYDIPFCLVGAANLNAWQLALQIDPAFAAVNGVIGLTAENVASRADGALRLLWFDAEGKRFLPGEALFTVQIRAIRPVRLSELLLPDASSLRAVSYETTLDGSDAQHPITVQSAAGLATSVQFFAPKPNPFDSETNFGLQLAQPSTVQLAVFDLSGRLLYQRRSDMNAGNQVVRLPADALPGSGMYLYRLSIQGETFAGKVLRW